MRYNFNLFVVTLKLDSSGILLFLFLSILRQLIYLSIDNFLILFIYLSIYLFYYNLFYFYFPVYTYLFSIYCVDCFYFILLLTILVSSFYYLICILFIHPCVFCFVLFISFIVSAVPPIQFSSLAYVADSSNLSHSNAENQRDGCHPRQNRYCNAQIPSPL